MYSELSDAEVYDELSMNAAVLGTLMKTVTDEAASLKKIPTNEWAGPASLFCELALDLLTHDLRVAHARLDDAQTDTQAAAFEVESHA
jgi:hypothetical protein